MLVQRTEQGLQNFPRFSKKPRRKVNKKVEQSANAIMNNLSGFPSFFYTRSSLCFVSFFVLYYLPSSANKSFRNCLLIPAKQNENVFFITLKAKKLLKSLLAVQIGAVMFKQSIGARNLVGIGLSYRPARLLSLAELVPWNQFLGSLKV
jgi:hypothetical protein